VDEISGFPENMNPQFGAIAHLRSPGCQLVVLRMSQSLIQMGTL
jgi:hypothetical protein